MKKILIILTLLVSTSAQANESFVRQYGVATTINFCLWLTDATALQTAAVAATGDCKIMKDEGADTNTTNLFVDEGNCYALTLTAAEMTAARILISCIDSPTKAFLDKSIKIETYNNPNAQHTSGGVSNFRGW
jgi:hypothetical protein